MPRRRKPAQPNVPTGLPYGDGEKLANAQRVIPVAPAPSPAPAGSTAPAPAGAAPALSVADVMRGMESPGFLTGGTTRPGEPVTAGLPIGAGPGPEALPVPAFDREDDVLLDLINAQRVSPSPALQRLIELHRNRTVARHRTLDAGRAVRRPRY